ncbi:hypothetical protein Tco_0889261 [Tanacetum coccineum]
MLIGGIGIGCLGDIKNSLKNEKHKQVIEIIKSCTLNALGDLTMTLRDLSVSGNGSGIGGNEMLDEEEIIKMLEEEEEMDELEFRSLSTICDKSAALVALGNGNYSIGASGALRKSTYLVIIIFIYPLEVKGFEVETFEVFEVKAFDFEALEVEAFDFEADTFDF